MYCRFEQNNAMAMKPFNWDMKIKSVLRVNVEIKAKPAAVSAVM
jgi:hypothetical protein